MERSKETSQYVSPQLSSYKEATMCPYTEKDCHFSDNCDIKDIHNSCPVYKAIARSRRELDELCNRIANTPRGEKPGG